MTTSIVKLLFLISLSIIPWDYAKPQNANPVLDDFRQLSIAEDNQLKILSWNIKMMPAPYGWFLKCHERAEDIIQFLKESDPYDIIFFQEAFSRNIRRKIYAGLKNIYPHEVEPEDQTAFYKINSGLWAISRLPITLESHITFSQFKEWDKLASKGAKLFSFTKDEQEFHLINTHMQSDYEIDYSDIRRNQYTEINNKLILPNKENHAPMILCGDLNISQPSQLKCILQKLKLFNGPLLGTLQNSIVGKSKGLMDYILVDNNHSKFKSIERRIIDFSNKLKDSGYNLSDHYPIEAVFNW